jgi:hypothetical protein
MASISATSTAGVTCFTAPTATVYGIRRATMICACSAGVAAFASSFSANARLSSGGSPLKSTASARGPGLTCSVA